MDRHQLIMAVQAEAVAYEIHRSSEQMHALQKAAAACRAAGIDVAPVLTSTVTDMHGPDEIGRRVREAIDRHPPTPVQRLSGTPRDTEPGCIACTTPHFSRSTRATSRSHGAARGDATVRGREPST